MKNHINQLSKLKRYYILPVLNLIIIICLQYPGFSITDLNKIIIPERPNPNLLKSKIGVVMVENVDKFDYSYYIFNSTKKFECLVDKKLLKGTDYYFSKLLPVLTQNNYIIGYYDSLLRIVGFEDSLKNKYVLQILDGNKQSKIKIYSYGENGSISNIGKLKVEADKICQKIAD